MIREVVFDDLDQLLELYLFLHEKKKPEVDTNLKEVWKQIIEDKTHHRE